MRDITSSKPTMGPVPWTQVGCVRSSGWLAGAVDGDGFLDGVDEPGDFSSVGDPLVHLVL